MALTWKTVSAPDFQGSMDALKTQQELLNKGLSGLTGAVQGFQTERTKRASDQLTQNLSRFTDPDSIDPGLAMSGIDPGLLTQQQLLEAAKAREGTLRTQQTEQAKRAVPGLQNQFFNLSPEAIQPWLQENAKTLELGGSQLANNVNAQNLYDAAKQQQTTRENKPYIEALNKAVATGNIDSATAHIAAFPNQYPSEALAKVTPIIDKHTVDQLIPQFTGSLKDTLGKATEKYNSLTPGQKPLFAAAYNKLVGTNAIGDSANDAETAAKIAAGEPLLSLGGKPTTNAAATGSNSITGFNAEEFRTKVLIPNESGGNSNAKPKLANGQLASSAGGTGQFLDKTWLEQIAKVAPDRIKGLSEKEILDLKYDNDLMNKVIDNYSSENATKLSKKGLPVDYATVYGAHFLGPDGIERVLTARDDTLIGKVVDGKSMAANENVFKNIKTVGDFKNWLYVDKAKIGRPLPPDEPIRLPDPERALIDSARPLQTEQTIASTVPVKKYDRNKGTAFPSLIPTESIYGREPVSIPTTALDAQAIKDRETASSLLNFNEKVGRGIADAAVLPVRGVAGAIDTIFTRPLRTMGVPATYLSPLVTPEGANVNSMTPFSDLGKKPAVNGKAAELIAGTAGITPAAASTGAESIPPQTDIQIAADRYANMNATQISRAVTSMGKVAASAEAARMGTDGRFLPEEATKYWGSSAGEIEANLKKIYPDIKSEKWQEALNIAGQKYPALTPAVIAEAISTAVLDKGFWESGVPVITWFNATDAIAPNKFKANLEKANKAVINSTLANEAATYRLEFAKKYAEQFAKAEQQLREAQLMADAMRNPNHPALVKAQKFFDEARQSAIIAAASLSTSK